MPESRLTLENIARAQLELRCGKTRRIVLRAALGGRQVCVPGVSTAANGWTVPGSLKVDSVLGGLVYLVSELGTVDGGDEQFRVSAVLTADGGHAPRHITFHECGGDEVLVVFGSEVLEYVPPPAKRPRATPGSRGSSQSASEPTSGSQSVAAADDA